MKILRKDTEESVVVFIAQRKHRKLYKEREKERDK